MVHKDNPQVKVILALEANMRDTIKTINEEFEDHLDSINGNTKEITALGEDLGGMESKLDHVNSRLDTIHLMLTRLVTQGSLKINLTLEEQRLFVLLYTGEKVVRLEELSRRTFCTEEEVKEDVLALIDKGIPILKKNINGKPCLILEEEFRVTQARENIIPIDPSVMQRMQNKELKNYFR
jgi:hypothetical protein